jgi:hypothetical protein
VIPQPDRALFDLATRVATSLTPAVSTVYGMADAGMISMLMMALAKEAGSGVERRAADGRELAALFASAEHAPDAEARADFAAGKPASLTHADVSAWLDEGLALLIDLHAWAEQEDAELDARIWDFLYRHTERHKLEI